MLLWRLAFRRCTSSPTRPLCYIVPPAELGPALQCQAAPLACTLCMIRYVISFSLWVTYSGYGPDLCLGLPTCSGHHWVIDLNISILITCPDRPSSGNKCQCGNEHRVGWLIVSQVLSLTWQGQDMSLSSLFNPAQEEEPAKQSVFIRSCGSATSTTLASVHGTPPS